jgi:hypothetical protein
MLLDTFGILFPIFLIAAAGFLFTKFFSLSIETLVRIVTDLFMPILVFYSLYMSDVAPRTIASLAGVTSFVVFALVLLAAGYSKLFKIDPKYFIPPIIFMNSGFLGIPLMKLWGGIAPMNYIVVYDQIQTIYIFTLGILIVTGGFSARGFKEMVKSPMLWAIVAGFLFNFLAVPIPDFLLRTLDFGGSAAGPLSIFALGASLNMRKFTLDIHLVAALLLRTVGGFLVGWLGCILFNITGPVKTVVLVASMLPSAVLSFVLPERYGVKADFPGAVVLISTVIGVFTIPIAFWLASLL